MTSISPESSRTIAIASGLIKESHYSVALTGAGISTPSGIPDFRSPGVGLWTQYKPMEVASLSAFRHHPEKFYQWLHPLAVKMYAAEPNQAHYALAELQQAGYLASIITQNIDGLHTRAGSTNVVEVHGTLETISCTGCFRRYPSKTYFEDYIDHCTIPHCEVCGSILKPDVILYEEQLPVNSWQQAENQCRKCELMLVVGTSLEVMPSAKLPIEALENKARLIIINQAATFVDVRADMVIHANAADVLPQIVSEVLNE
jgi:NAD-dependent deacetylase